MTATLLTLPTSCLLSADCGDRDLPDVAQLPQVLPGRRGLRVAGEARPAPVAAGQTARPAAARGRGRVQGPAGGGRGAGGAVRGAGGGAALGPGHRPRPDQLQHRQRSPGTEPPGTSHHCFNTLYGSIVSNLSAREP